jgi:hypothetical protein
MAALSDGARPFAKQALPGEYLEVLWLAVTQSDFQRNSTRKRSPVIAK